MQKFKEFATWAKYASKTAILDWSMVTVVGGVVAFFIVDMMRSFPVFFAVAAAGIGVSVVSVFGLAHLFRFIGNRWGD